MCGKIIFLLFLGVFPGVLSNPRILLKFAEGYEQCEAALRDVAAGVSNGELWALKILDSSTKFPSGILTGHLTDFGNFDECFENQTIVKTHYCPVNIKLPLGSGSQSVSVRWNYCIPAACPKELLQSALSQLALEINLDVNVTVKNCLTNEEKVLQDEDKVGISIWGVFVGLACFSTIYDLVMKWLQKKPNPWLISFSMYTNGKNLLKVEVTPETMTPLHGLRFLSICWVILGHRFFFTTVSSVLNLTDLAKELQTIKSQFFIQGVLAVDTFFFLSGFLNSYNLLKILKKLNRFPFILYYVHRFVRLTPPLAAVVVMYATWYSLLGNGPGWKEATGVWKQFCVDNWWPTLLYINNYYNPMAQCAGQSWYLAVDMQLYCLTPLVILPLWKRPKIGKLLLFSLVVISVLIQLIIAYVYKFRMSFAFGFNEGEDYEKILKYLYLPTHTRATPYIIGLIFGAYMNHLRSNKTIIVMTKVLVAVGWFFSTAFCLSVFLGNFQFSRPLEDHPYNRLESSFYIALHRVGWSLGIAWIIFACLNKYGGFVNSILSWKFFVPLSRLSYCLFLSHMAIQQFHIGTARTPDYIQYFNQIHQFFGDLCLSIFAATFLSLVFESPNLVLIKLLSGKKKDETLKGETNKGFEEVKNNP